MKKANIVDQVMKNIPISRRLLSWEDVVSEENKEKLEAIRGAWLAGKFGPSIYPAARAIAKTLNDEGISPVKHSGVVRWLRGS